MTLNSAGKMFGVEPERIIAGVIRAAQLNRPFYEVLEHDVSYTRDAWAVVVVTAVAAAIGGFLKGLLWYHSLGLALGSLFSKLILGILVYFVWAYLIQIIGVRLFHATTDFGEVQRTLGFAYAPQLLQIFAFIPVLGSLATAIGMLWSLVCAYIGIKQALNLDTANTIATVVVAAIPAIVITAVLARIF